MENYIVSARKYRPSSFDSVVGQRALTTTLKNAISSGKLAHAYLFCGPRGVGKTTCARIFAKTINCQHLSAEGEACNECESCMAFNEQRSYNIFELDAASNNSVDDIRNLIEEVRIPPQIGKYKVYIIDEVHMLSAAAFNAFLKTLEEPPKHAVFILATTEKHKLLPTILSRCQIYDFNRIGVNDIIEHLQYVAEKEGVKTEPEALMVIAQKADGGMRDALSIFDQVVSFTQGNITYKSAIENLNVLDYEYYFQLTDMLLANKVSDALLLFNTVLQKGFDGNHFITGLASHLRDLLVSKDASTLSLLEVSNNVKTRYRNQAQNCSPRFLFKAMKLCNDCDLNYRTSKNKRLLVELTLIECAQLTAPSDEVAEGHGPKIKPTFQQTTAQTTGTTQGAVTSKASTVSKPTTASQAKASDASKQTAPVAKKSPFPEEKPQAPKIQTVSLSDTSIKRIQQKNKGDQTVTNKEQTQTNTQSVENKPFSETDLDLAWREYAAALPVEQKANAQRMMAIRPKLLDANTFQIVVYNKLAAESMQSLSASIEQSLQQKLQNSLVKMQIHVSEVSEEKRAFTASEKLDVMLKKSDKLKELKKTLGLELA